jgi:hypothetical protein
LVTLCISLVLAILFLVYLCSSPRPVKKFSTQKPTNILVTGGVQGLGKLLVGEFLSKTKSGSVNLIVVDIADNLEK